MRDLILVHHIELLEAPEEIGLRIFPSMIRLQSSDDCPSVGVLGDVPEAFTNIFTLELPEDRELSRSRLRRVASKQRQLPDDLI